MAEVKYTSRFILEELLLKKDSKVFNRGVGFVDEDFLEMFTYPLKYGSKEALLDTSKIFLRADIAEEYFGDRDPTGEVITLFNIQDKKFLLTVGGVLEDMPYNTSIWFEALTTHENYYRIRNIDRNNWEKFIDATFVMTEGQFPQDLIEDINANFIEIQNLARENTQITDYYAVPLEDISKHINTTHEYYLSYPPTPSTYIIPIIMSLVMLLVACFNFTNTSIAISGKRLKEVGIRKVLGSSRKQLIIQFMGEHLVLSFGALLFGLGVASFLVPTYSSMWSFINLKLSLVSHPDIFGFLTVLLIGVSLVAGGYSSIYVSSFSTLQILKGSFSLGRVNWFSKILLGLQYTFTIIALISSLAFFDNIHYQASIDLGFEHEKIMTVWVRNQSEYNKFSNAIDQMPEITASMSTQNHIGGEDYDDYNSYIRVLRSGQAEIESYMMNLSIDYAEFMNLAILEGRYFDPDLYEYDQKNSIIVNESLVKIMNWEDPIGRVVQIDDSTRLTIIGVMRDFYMYGFTDNVVPTSFRLVAKDAMKHFIVLKSDLPPPKLRELVESKWYEICPNSVFNAFFMNRMLARSEQTNINLVKITGFQGFLALLLSLFGLYTLVSLTVIKREKEIGIRRVLGATVSQILILINRQFFWILLIATTLGSVVSYFIIEAFMSVIFDIYQVIKIPTILIPFVFLIVMFLGIASIRILHSVQKSPTQNLRDE